MSRSEPLLLAFDSQFGHQRRRHRRENPRGRRVRAPPAPVAVQRTGAQIMAVARPVAGKLYAGGETPGLGGLINRPVTELAQQQPSGHRLEFLGRPSDRCVKVLPQLFRRQELEAAAAQDSFPPLIQPAPGRGGQLRVPPGPEFGVEKPVLQALIGRFEGAPILG